jgi:hypothetical protein
VARAVHVVEIEIPNSRRDLDRAPLSCAEAGETKKIVRSQIEGDGLLVNTSYNTHTTEVKYEVLRSRFYFLIFTTRHR